MNRSDITVRNTAYFVVLALLIGAIIPLTTHSGGLNFSENKMVVNDNIRQNALDIGVTDAGEAAKVYIAYEDEFINSEPHVLFKRSINGGQSFSAPLDFFPDAPVHPSANRLKTPRIAVLNDVVAIVYTDNTERVTAGLPSETMLRCAVSQNQGETFVINWVTPTSAGYPSTTIQYPDIAIDPNYNIFIVWKEKKDAEPGERIYISYSTDYGTSWSTPAKVKENQYTGTHSDYWQRWPSVAADSDHVYVAWTAEPDWREQSFFVRASTSNIPTSLSFDEVPMRLSAVYDSDHLYPQLAANDDILHIVWWDFITDDDKGLDSLYDPTGKVRDPSMQDRGGILHMYSENGGTSFSDRRVINTSTPDGWHSPPTIDIGGGGVAAVSWVDFTLDDYKKHPNVWVSTSTDGETWSVPDKVTEYRPNIDKWAQRVAVDTGGNVHMSWFILDEGTDWDIQYAKSIINQPPEPITFTSSPFVAEFAAKVFWDPNRESDFKQYKVYISNESADFDPDEDEWPVGNRYNISTYQGMNQEYFTGLTPDRDYWVKVAVEDTGGLITFVEEAMKFHTEPINLPPFWVKTVGDIHMEEDGALLGAINLTELKKNGYIQDDKFKGKDDLMFGHEFESGDPIISARISTTISGNDTYYTLDLFARPEFPNEAGEERMRLKAIDAGTDGGFNTDDDLWGWSNWFTVFIDPTNDRPYWVGFQDRISGKQINLQAGQTTMRLPEADSGATEDLQYQFTLYCLDADPGDFISYSTNRPDWINIKVDVNNDPQHRSIFTLTPTNDDVPEFNITVEASDSNGGTRNITLFIPVQNMNDDPQFLTVNGTDVTNITEYWFTIVEEESVSFKVTATDLDAGDRLILTASPSPDNLDIQKDTVFPNTWTVSYESTKEDSGKEIEFTLNVEDKDYASDQFRIVIDVKNAPDPPYFIGEKITLEYIYDKEDQNEWGGGGGENIRAEWGEEVEFRAHAADPDQDPLNFTWTVRDISEPARFVRKYYGESFRIAFMPTNGDLQLLREKFRINVTISDGRFAPIKFQIEEFIWKDDDNDNDGMPDIREFYFFGGLGHPGDEDFDNDTYSNMEEIGFGVERAPSEFGSDPEVDPNAVPDPTNPESYPGRVNPPVVENGEKEDEEGLETWHIIVIVGAVVIILALIIGVVLVFRISKQREREDDEAAEKFIKEQEKRQKELEGMYGKKMKVGEIVGPDQSTLSDLKIDLGGQVYHDDGRTEKIKKRSDEQKDGPKWESAGSGPVFEDKAPGIELGESLKLETVPGDDEEPDHSEIDEGKLEESMADILDSAEKYKEEEMVKAGGNVLVGAVPMEEQIRQMKGEQGAGGPRLPPPGQEPPQQGDGVPGQRPPQMQGPQGLPPARPAPPREDNG